MRGRGRPIGSGKKLWGEDNPMHNPLATDPNTGRTRARYKYKGMRKCQGCGKGKTEIHHVDGNTFNNDPSNIRFLCRRCHMLEDGRLKQFASHGPSMKMKAQIEVECDLCGVVITMRSGDYSEKLRYNKHRKVFCGRSCAGKFSRSQRGIGEAK